MSIAIKLSRTSTSMKVMGVINLPVTISIYVVARRINGSTGANLSVTIFTPGIASISGSITRSLRAVFDFIVTSVVGRIQLTIGLSTLSTYCFILTGCSATSMFARFNESNKSNLVICRCICLCSGIGISFNCKALYHTIFFSTDVVVTKCNFSNFCIFTENGNFLQRSTIIESCFTDFFYSFGNNNTSDFCILNKRLSCNGSYGIFHATNGIFRTNNDVTSSAFITLNSDFGTRC